MAASKGLGTTGNGAGTVTPLDHKLAQAGLIAKTGAGTNLVRPGLFYDGVSTIVSGKANMSYDVAPFTAALTRGATAGAVLLSNDGTVNVATTAAPGSNSRIDSVYVWQREFSLDGTDSNPVIGVVQGTAAASPTAPSLAAFPGAIELARITVPAGVTATNSGTTITQTAPFTAPAGGIVTFRNSTERDAATVTAGTLGFLLSDSTRHVSTGSGWVADASGLVAVVPTSVAGSGVTVNAAGLVTFTTATAVNVNGCFTSAYANYLVQFRVPTRSVAGQVQLRMRLAGTDNTASEYDYQRLVSSSTNTASTTAAAANIWDSIAGGNRATQRGEFTFFSPAVAVPTFLDANISDSDATANFARVGYSGWHRASTAFDGFSLISSTGNITGTLKVYGYN